MKINLASINLDEFFVTPRENGILIVPKKDKFKWTLEEAPLRSLLVDTHGEILSMGFPKFFNYGENTEYDAEFMAAMEENPDDIYYAPKLDGSLIIRSIFHGKVCFRTRGSHTLQGDEEDQFNGQAVIKLINDRYPFLTNSCGNESSEISELFEYTAPTNHIVIKYDDSNLTYLGWVDHYTGQYHPPLPKTMDMERYFNERFPTRYPEIRLEKLPKSLEEMSQEVSKWEGKEGIVVYVKHGTGFLLTKMKSEWYFKLHSILTGTSTSNFRKMMYDNQIQSLQTFRSYLAKQELDFEVYTYLKPRAELFLEDLRKAKEEVFALYELMVDQKLLDETMTRKDQVNALKQITTSKEQFTLGIWILDGKEQDYVYMKALDMSPAQFHGYEREKATK